MWAGVVSRVRCSGLPPRMVVVDAQGLLVVEGLSLSGVLGHVGGPALDPKNVRGYSPSRLGLLFLHLLFWNQKSSVSNDWSEVI